MLDDLPVSGRASATDPGRLGKFFGGEPGLLPLWIAEPYVELAPDIREALADRAALGWYGYEARPPSVQDAFRDWMGRRHQWDLGGLHLPVSPSVGTSIGVLMDHITELGEGVILQPPVFTDFKPLVRRSGREPLRNSLLLTDDGYRMDLESLEELAANPTNTMMILCNPHNPVGRVWSAEELAAVAEISARHDVFVVADEIHADLALPPHRFTPFATVAASTSSRWAATHGPIKTFGLAGVSDTLLITSDQDIADHFRATASRFHLNRNNVFGVAALEAAYRSDGTWLDRLLDTTRSNLDLLRSDLPAPVGLVEPEGTYLAWLDFRGLGLEVPELAAWLGERARLALSPGHWFGREGAGFARMTVAVPSQVISEAVDRLREGVAAL